MDDSSSLIVFVAPKVILLMMAPIKKVYDRNFYRWLFYHPSELKLADCCSLCSCAPSSPSRAQRRLNLIYFSILQISINPYPLFHFTIYASNPTILDLAARSTVEVVILTLQVKLQQCRFIKLAAGANNACLHVKIFPASSDANLHFYPM